MSTIANMTIEELKQLVDTTIEQRLSRITDIFEIADMSDDSDNLTWDEIRASVNQHRWTPPAHAKSSSAFLREDRDR